MIRCSFNPPGESAGSSRGSIRRKARILGWGLLPAILTAALIALSGLGAHHADASLVRITAVPTAAAIQPPMGWNDWYEDRCAVTEAEILTSARQLVSTGLAGDGYNTVVITTAGWHQRDQPPEHFSLMRRHSLTASLTSRTRSIVLASSSASMSPPVQLPAPAGRGPTVTTPRMQTRSRAGGWTSSSSIPATFRVTQIQRCFLTSLELPSVRLIRTSCIRRNCR